MSGSESLGEYLPLKRVLDSSKREEIERAIKANPRMGEEELAEIFGRDEVEAYYSNPDARGFDDAA